MHRKWDFSGWASKNDLRCADGRVIRRNAFSVNDGKRVPLVWNHRHDSVGAILGHAILENRKEGVFAYGYFNDTEAGKNAKEAVKHGDVTSLSIWANNLDQVGPEVHHGVIREVSLVLAGANPGAFIESAMAHGEPMGDGDDEGIFYTGEDLYLEHAEEIGNEESSEEKGEENMENKTVQEVFDTLNDEQKKAVAIIIGQAIEDASGETEEDEDEEEEDEEVRHSVFDEEYENSEYLSHADMEEIIDDAKRLGSLRDSLDYHMTDGVLAHAVDTTGMEVATGTQQYGFNDPSMLFPEYKALSTTPEWISRNMDWVQKVFSKVHRTPFSRIKSVYANITEDEARARGYIKGKQKKEEFFTTLKRTTDPQTIYKKQKMDRDDVLDITGFDVIAWIKSEMRVMLNEEIARAVLIGDGRPSDSDDKIQELHVRPIATDVPLFNVKVEIEDAATSDETTKNLIKEIIRARKKYKGSGNPDFFTTEDVLTDMLLLEDNNGRRLYKTQEELATTLRVKEIITVEVMEDHKVGEDLLLGIIVNLADYNIGADKGGEINNFEDFDIDFNQMKYLIETRISGALIKPYSAMTIVKKGTASGSSYSARRSSMND